MRQAASADTVGTTGWAIRGALVALALAAGAYTFSTFPGVRATGGFVPAVDGWIQGPAFVFAALVAALRPAVSGVDRLVWSLVAVALALRASAYIVYFSDIRTRDPQPYPSLADAGWLASSLALLAMVTVLVRPQARRFSLLLVLDAVAAALTVGSVAMVLLWDTLVDRLDAGADISVVAVNLAYPLLDVALLVVCAGYLTMVRWHPPRGVAALMIGIVCFAVIDAVFLHQITEGTFRPASPLSGLNMVATATIAYAAWVDRHTAASTPHPATVEGRTTAAGFWVGPRGVLLPAVCAVVCVAVLVYGAAHDQPFTSALLPLAGLVVVITRGATTLFTERTTAEHEMRLKNEELLRFQSLVEASNDFIAIADVDGSVMYLNPAGRDLVGVALDSDVTRTTIMDYLTEDGIRDAREIERPAVLSQGHWEGESTLRNQRDGPAIPVAISSFVMLHPTTREPIAIATVQRDISDMIAAEQARQVLAYQRKELLDRLVVAQEDERARIAAGVHDDSVQALAAVELRLGLLRRRLRERAPDLTTSVDEMSDTVGTATERLRHLLFDLDSPALHDDLAGALDQAASYVFEGGTLSWRVIGDRTIDLPQGLRVTAYRIAKEAMVNAHKHAGARHVTVRIVRSDGGIEIQIADDGRGIQSEDLREQPGHLGLSSMHDRAEVAGGSLRLETPPEGGTVVCLWLPDPPTA